MERMLRVIIINAITVTYIIQYQRAAIRSIRYIRCEKFNANAQPFGAFGTFVVKRLSTRSIRYIRYIRCE